MIHPFIAKVVEHGNNLFSAAVFVNATTNNGRINGTVTNSDAILVPRKARYSTSKAAFDAALRLIEEVRP